MFWLLALALSGEGAGPARPAALPVSTVHPVAAYDMLTSPARRIRAGTTRFSTLLIEGARRSRTFAGLVARVHDTDVIVYIEQSFELPPDITGRMLLQTVAGGQRYLRIQVRATLQGDQIIAVIGHELRHALEVADDPTVQSDAGLLALYRRIGRNTVGWRGFDTEAAEIAGRMVRDELIG